MLRHKSGQQRRRRGSQTLAQTPRTRARAASRVPEKEMTRIRSQRLWVLSGSLVTRGAGRHEDALDRARGPRLPLSHTEFEGAPFHSPAAASPWRLTQPAIQHGEECTGGLGERWQGARRRVSAADWRISMGERLRDAGRAVYGDGGRDAGETRFGVHGVRAIRA